MSVDSEKDSAIIARVAQKDMHAMRLIYERHHGAVHSFVRSRGGSAGTADDVMHDAMLEVWRSAEKYRGTASVRTWIITIARNKYVDKVRGSARLMLVETVPETIDSAPNPEEVIDASKDAKRVRCCLGKLKDVQRTVIHLVFYEELSYEEVAGLENVPVGTIKSRVFHAKKALLHCLGGVGCVTAVRQ